jgi:hypothetical protein
MARIDTLTLGSSSQSCSTSTTCIPWRIRMAASTGALPTKEVSLAMSELSSTDAMVVSRLLDLDLRAVSLHGEDCGAPQEQDRQLSERG